MIYGRLRVALRVEQEGSRSPSASSGLSQTSSSSLLRITGIRLWMGAMSWLGSVVMMV
jgi:hypothetical protein